MVRTLLDDWRATKRRILSGKLQPAAGRKATIACGALIAPTLQKLAEEAACLTGLRLQVVPIRNTLFGARVNVSGLLPGQDFIDQLAQLPAAERGETVFLPRASLDYFGKHFLDDITPDSLSRAIDARVAFAYNLGDVIEWLSGEDRTPPGRARRSNGRSWAIVGE
jgi:hypothetical protein